jgi:tetratricopeptide (TPR) repeat protein
MIGGWYWWAQSQGVSMFEAIKIIVQEKKTINLDNPDEIFTITIPDNFDDARKERLSEKISQSRVLYDTKKDDTWTWITIGSMYEFVHDYDRALAAYERAASLNPGEFISRTDIAYIYENNKINYPKAEEYYKKVLEISPNNPDSYINLARLYEFKMNKPEEAEKIYLAGLEKTNNYSDLLVMTIRFYQNRANAGKVSEYSKLLLMLYPDNPVYIQDFGAFVK